MDRSLGASHPRLVGQSAEKVERYNVEDSEWLGRRRLDMGSWLLIQNYLGSPESLFKERGIRKPNFSQPKKKLTTFFGPGLVLFESHLLLTVAWKAVSPMMRTRPEDP